MALPSNTEGTDSSFPLDAALNCNVQSRSMEHKTGVLQQWHRDSCRPLRRQLHAGISGLRSTHQHRQHEEAMRALCDPIGTQVLISSSMGGRRALQACSVSEPDIAVSAGSMQASNARECTCSSPNAAMQLHVGSYESWQHWHSRAPIHGGKHG